MKSTYTHFTILFSLCRFLKYFAKTPYVFRCLTKYFYAGGFFHDKWFTREIESASHEIQPFQKRSRFFILNNTLYCFSKKSFTSSSPASSVMYWYNPLLHHQIFLFCGLFRQYYRACLSLSSSHCETLPHIA